MTHSEQDFFSFRAELARSLAGEDSPITFVLGAGASTSSGAPTSAEVADTLRRGTRVRLGNDPHHNLHEIVDDEVRSLLAPLFSDVSPGVGYRLLAARHAVSAASSQLRLTMLTRRIRPSAASKR